MSIVKLVLKFAPVIIGAIIAGAEGLDNLHRDEKIEELETKIKELTNEEEETEETTEETEGE